MNNMLMHLAKAIVGNVLSQLTQQLNIVQNSVMQPMRSIVQLVTGGSIWIGDGANAFVQEVSTLAIPGVGKVAQNVQFFSQNLSKAVSTMEQADSKVKGIAQNLGQTFSGIYSG